MGWNQWVARATTRTGFGALAATVALAAAALAPVTASAGISDTKHNLRSAVAGNNSFSGNDTAGNANTEICVFCHTPHGADTTAAVPLWNRNVTTPPTYTTYDKLATSTMDGTITALGAVSLACLSCHDGTQAMSTVINAPGSGGYNASGAAMSGTWTGGNVNLTVNGTAPIGSIKGGITLIGTDLKNDHPIGMQYAGGGGTTKAQFKDQDFKALAAPATLNGTQVWWVDTETTANGSRQKTDMILYTRADGAPYVECASCHDPHVSENPTFLRIKNDNSAVCLACHIK